MWNFNIIQIFRSNLFAFWIALLSVVVQSPHSFYVFYYLSGIKSEYRTAQSILFAVIIDMALMFYTLRNRKDIAIMGGVATTLINIFYYWIVTPTYLQFTFGCFLSLILPGSVYFYSEEIREKSKKRLQL